MSLDEETLQNVAREGEMDYTKWPNIIEPLLDRLNQIIYDEFSMPRPFPNLNRQTAPPSPTQNRAEATSEATQAATQSTTSQQQPQQPTTPVRNLPPVPLFPNSSATHVSESAPPSQDQPTASQSHPLDPLPTALIQLLNSITSTLRSSFLSKPPHTIQRLAELILEPRKHYKTLPAWLRAIDRVVNVSSSADIFPLTEGPAVPNGVINGEGGGGILWKNDDTRNAADLGSDESLGGALLTPIPWLRNRASSVDVEVEQGDETQDLYKSGDSDQLGAELDRDAAGSSSDDKVANGHQDPLVPEREDGAVTQGELIRMEQEAGVVPVAQTGPPPRGMEREEVMDGDDGENVPHARGPVLVGAVDMGKVEGREVEVRISSPPSGEGGGSGVRDAQEVLEGGPEAKKVAGEEGKAVSGGGGGGGEEEEFEMVQRGDEMEVDSEDAMKTVEGEASKDEDMVLVDADGKMDDEEKVGGGGETKGGLR